MNLQFHIAVDNADALANYLAESAHNNDMLQLEGPIGSFVLDENSPRSLVFIAEGIGFAAIKGLIEHAMALDSAEQLHLLWIAADDQPPYLHNLCRAWNDALDNFHYPPLSASAVPELGDQLRQMLQSANPTDCDYYICASESVRAHCEQFAADRAVPASQYLFEPMQVTGVAP
jgi:CDP-4-dehydro-6-deoxyglucose reductase